MWIIDGLPARASRVARLGCADRVLRRGSARRRRTIAVQPHGSQRHGAAVHLFLVPGDDEQRDAGGFWHISAAAWFKQRHGLSGQRIFACHVQSDRDVSGQAQAEAAAISMTRNGVDAFLRQIRPILFGAH